MHHAIDLLNDIVRKLKMSHGDRSGWLQVISSIADHAENETERAKEHLERARVKLRNNGEVQF